MSFKTIPLSVCALFITCSAFAQNPTDQVIDSFLNCNDQFFQTLAENKSALSEYVDISETPDGTVYIPVKNVEKNHEDTVMFKKPISYKGLTIIGYQNIYVETTLFGQYYYWGFVFDNNVQDIKKAIDQFNWRQYSNETFITHAQIYDRKNKSAGWQDNPYTIDGTIPKSWTVEKSIYLETIPTNHSHLVCSLQGDLDKGILYQFRPDMKFIDQKIDSRRKKLLEKIKMKQSQNHSANDNQTAPKTEKSGSEI